MLMTFALLESQSSKTQAWWIPGTPTVGDNVTLRDESIWVVVRVLRQADDSEISHGAPRG